MKVNSYALGTVKRYAISIKKMVGKKNYISPRKIKAYLSMKNTLSKRAAVRLFLVFLEDMHSIKIEPFRYPRLISKKSVLEVISKDSFNKILNEMRPNFKLFMKVMYYGGLRLSECVRLETDWFNWQKWIEDTSKHCDLKIIKAKRNKERIVPIHPDLMREIFYKIPKHAEWNIKKSHVFDFKHSLYIYRKKKKGFPEEVAEVRYVEKVSRFFQISLNEASERAIGKRIKTHMLRSSRATALDAAGVQPSNIQYFLGHDNLVTTPRYITNTPEKVNEKISQVDDYN